MISLLALFSMYNHIYKTVKNDIQLSSDWDFCLGVVHNTQSYRNILTHYFNGGRVTQSHLKVVKWFTEDVCERNPHLANNIWDIYHAFLYSNDQ